MRLLLAVSATALVALSPALAQQKAAAPAASPKVEAGLAIRPSKLPVKETIDAIAKSAEEKGAKVVARVDHAAGAKAVNVDMKPSQLLLFGNPKVGTPLMQGNVRAGLDLPLKVLAYEDAAGKTWVVYQTARELGRKYKLKGKAEQEAVKAAGMAIDGVLTGAAIAP
jgi:uncharacterized protein (DUF302 family)